MDLIEVAPSERPPICRVGDWGRSKYQRDRAKSRQRKNQRGGALKEVKVRPKTDDHDIEVKVKNASRFLGSVGGIDRSRIRPAVARIDVDFDLTGS